MSRSDISLQIMPTINSAAVVFLLFALRDNYPQMAILRNVKLPLDALVKMPFPASEAPPIPCV